MVGKQSHLDPFWDDLDWYLPLRHRDIATSRQHVTLADVDSQDPGMPWTVASPLPGPLDADRLMPGPVFYDGLRWNLTDPADPRAD